MLCASGDDALQLLMFYGFLLENNPYDTIPISLSLDEEDLHAAQKAAILEAHGACKRGQDLLHLHPKAKSTHSVAQSTQPSQQ